MDDSPVKVTTRPEEEGKNISYVALLECNKGKSLDARKDNVMAEVTVLLETPTSKRANPVWGLSGAQQECQHTSKRLTEGIWKCLSPKSTEQEWGGPKAAMAFPGHGSGCGSRQLLQGLREVREVFKEHYRNSAVPSYCIISDDYHNFTR